MKKLSLIYILIICCGYKSIAQTVTIGSQVWMTKNLTVAKFRNGDPIPEAKTADEWDKAAENQQPAWCYYDNDPANGKTYGKLYNWYAVNDPRGLAPTGYHVPSDEEWIKLTDFLGYDAGDQMKSTSKWSEGGNGNNSSGFSGLPGGSRTVDGTFHDVGEYGYWWSSTETSTRSAWYRYLSYAYINVAPAFYSKAEGMAVRCLRD